MSMHDNWDSQIVRIVTLTCHMIRDVRTETLSAYNFISKCWSGRFVFFLLQYNICFVRLFGCYRAMVVYDKNFVSCVWEELFGSNKSLPNAGTWQLRKRCLAAAIGQKWALAKKMRQPGGLQVLACLYSCRSLFVWECLEVFTWQLRITRREKPQNVVVS